MKIILLSLVLVSVAAGPALSQYTHQPYAGQQERAIKALDPTRIDGLRNGAGLGYAKAAELNGWPGPLHALELREALDLSSDQIATMEHLRRKMLAEAQPLGRELIAAERALDDLFAADQADPAAIDTVIAQAAEIEGRLRAVHLRTHIEAKPVLSRHQLVRYAKLRGYTHGAQHKGHGG